MLKKLKKYIALIIVVFTLLYSWILQVNADTKNISFSSAKLFTDSISGIIENVSESSHIEYYKYKVNKGGYLELNFEFENSNQVTAEVEKLYKKSILVVTDERKQVIDIHRISRLNFVDKMGVKKGIYYIIVIFEAEGVDFSQKINYKITAKQDKSNGYEQNPKKVIVRKNTMDYTVKNYKKELKQLPDIADKIGVKGKINFNSDVLELAIKKIKGLKYNELSNGTKFDEDYVYTEIKKSGTYVIGFKNVDMEDEDALSFCRGFIYIFGPEWKKRLKYTDEDDLLMTRGEPERGEFMIYDYNDNLFIKTKLEKGTILKASINSYYDKCKNLWYKSYIKKVK